MQKIELSKYFHEEDIVAYENIIRMLQTEDEGFIDAGLQVGIGTQNPILLSLVKNLAMCMKLKFEPNLDFIKGIICNSSEASYTPFALSNFDILGTVWKTPLDLRLFRGYTNFTFTGYHEIFENIVFPTNKEITLRLSSCTYSRLEKMLRTAKSFSHVESAYRESIGYSSDHVDVVCKVTF